MRAIITDGSGVIKRIVGTSADLLALQIGDGESGFAITNDTGAFIDDAVIRVSEGGALEVTEAAPEGTTAPDFTIELIA